MLEQTYHSSVTIHTFRNLLMKMFTGWQSYYFFRRNLFWSEPISAMGGAEAHLTLRVAFCHKMS